MNYISSYMSIFCNRTDLYFRQRVLWRVSKDENKVIYTKVAEPLTRAVINSHLSGKQCIALPAIDEHSNAKWCAWDGDDTAGSIGRIDDLLRSWNLIPYREGRRAGRDGHLWLFFDRKISSENLLAFHRYVMSHANVLPSQIEFFPKTANKHSQIRGPLGRHCKPIVPVRGFFEDCKPNVLAQLKFLANIQRTEAAWIEEVAKVAREQERADELAVYRARRQCYSTESILDLVPVYQWNGREYYARCPCCYSQGHDKSGDNLRITHDGLKWNCVYKGVNQVHKPFQILKELKRLNTQGA